MSTITFLLAQNDTLSFLLVYFSVYMAIAILALVVKHVVFKNGGPWTELCLLGTLLIVGLPFIVLYSHKPHWIVAVTALNLALLLASKLLFKNYMWVGLNFYLANIATILVGIPWSALFLITLPVSLTTKLLMLSAAPLLLIALPSGILMLIEQYDVVCRNKWLVPSKPYPARARNTLAEPFVSIHVPTYSEPPEIVMETLLRLSRLEYSNYEVILIDNNTEDPNLWLPVKAYCRKLGPRFRFMHVDSLPGAKGGALNYALEKTAIGASLVAVIDADYHAEPEFLKALVGYFDNARIGFVQTPHDYRGWRGNLYLAMCYWEYKLFFHTAMVSLSEHGAGLTVGTMCIIRKEALKKAGGWSMTCVTEDSELAIRIHNAGYTSVYVDTTYGRGLIPDNFSSYKKQRYRWTAGPVQEFRDHFGLYFGLSDTPSNFTFLQRLFHINHGLNNVLIGAALPFGIVSMLTVISMVYHREIVEVPFELWLTATILLLASPTLNWLMFKTRLNAGLKEMILLIIANRALHHVVSYAAFRTTLTGNATWTRTSKFRAEHSFPAAILNAKEELVIGLLIAAFIGVMFTLMPYMGLALMLMIGLAYLSIAYLTAPLLSIISVFSMRRQEAKKQSPQTFGEQTRTIGNETVSWNHVVTASLATNPRTTKQMWAGALAFLIVTVAATASWYQLGNQSEAPQEILLEPMPEIVALREENELLSPPPALAPLEHVIQAGETLRSVSQDYYGDEAMWPTLYSGPDPDLILPGETLLIYPILNEGITANHS